MPPSPSAPIAGATEPDEDPRLRLYRLIIDRYRDKIEEYETKSVSDLKLLIQPRTLDDHRDMIGKDSRQPFMLGRQRHQGPAADHHHADEALLYRQRQIHIGFGDLTPD